jgi:hypothetical protein
MCVCVCVHVCVRVCVHVCVRVCVCVRVGVASSRTRGTAHTHHDARHLHTHILTRPHRWGPFGSRAALPPLRRPISAPPPPATNPAAAAAATAARRAHPLYATITLQLLSEVVNSRLFTTVRDSLGLTYDVSFEVRAPDRVSTRAWALPCTAWRVHPLPPPSGPPPHTPTHTHTHTHSTQNTHDT